MFAGMSNEKLAELEASIFCAVRTTSWLRHTPADALHTIDESEFHTEPSRLDPPNETCWLQCIKPNKVPMTVTEVPPTVR